MSPLHSASSLFMSPYWSYLYLHCGDHCNILSPPKQIAERTEIKLTSWPAANKKFPACDSKLDDVTESFIGKIILDDALRVRAAARAWTRIQHYHLGSVGPQCYNMIIPLQAGLPINLRLFFLNESINHFVSEMFKFPSAPWEIVSLLQIDKQWTENFRIVNK